MKLDTIKDTLIELHSAGLTLAPCKESKAPYTDVKGEWRHLIGGDRMPFDTILNLIPRAWGIGIVCGNSGEMVLDFDLKYDPSRTIFQEFKNIVEVLYPDVWDKLYIETSVNGGYHAIYKTTAPTRNEKLASDEEGKKAIIETRGSGGYCVTFPTGGYVPVQGRLDNLQHLSEVEHESLIKVCKSLSRFVKEESVKPKERVKHERVSVGKSPFEAYNEAGCLVDDLVNAGWKLSTMPCSKAGAVYLARPDKAASAVSASWGWIDDRLYVWTTSTRLPSEKPLDAVEAYTQYFHGGDYSAAARDLLQRGFGEVPKYRHPERPIGGRKSYTDKDKEKDLSFEDRLDAAEEMEEFKDRYDPFAGETPRISEEVYKRLPNIFHPIVSKLSGRKRDVAFLYSLPIIGAAIEGLHVAWDGIERTSLYFLAVANAGSGKGVASSIMGLADEIHKERKERYKNEYTRWEMNKIAAKANKQEFTEKEPNELKFKISPNSSTSALTYDLINNQGIMMDTEADGLVSNAKNDWGGYSEIARKAYHSEPISINRVGKVQEEVEKPVMSIALTCTPDQVAALIGTPANGLISRFSFYRFREEYKFKLPSLNTDRNSELKQGIAVSAGILKMMSKAPYTVVKFDDEQNSYLQQLGDLYSSKIAIYGDDAVQINNRSFVQLARICAIVAFCRAWEAGYKDETYSGGGFITPNTHDLYIAVCVFEVLYWNNIRTFAWLSDQDKGGRKEESAGEKATNNAIYEQMPHKIRSGKGGDFAGIAQKFGISESYFRNLISKLKKRGLVEKVGKDYIKTPQGAPSIVDKETGEVFDLNTNVLADIEKAFK